MGLLANDNAGKLVSGQEDCEQCGLPSACLSTVECCIYTTTVSHTHAVTSAVISRS